MYRMTNYNQAVAYYKKNISAVKGKSALIIFDVDQKDAFYSLAPLSQALHELGADCNVYGIGKSTRSLDVLKSVWTCYDEWQSGVKNPATKALADFVKEADKKCKGKIKKLFAPPDLFLKAEKKGFEGSFNVEYRKGWITEHKPRELLTTAKIIWDQVYNLKKSENVSVGFELIKAKKDMGLPLRDYLDSFQISYAMMKAVKSQVVGMSSSTSRLSQLDEPERISDLRATLLGCELSKKSDEPVFKRFKVLSKLLRIDRIQIASAVFGIHGKGYPGRHCFGENIGYPSPNKKTRWLSPGQMVYKLDFYPQTALDPRMPLARIAFTETVPLDIFIKTCKIDWLAMQKRDHSIINIANKCDHIIVEGKKFGKYQTKLKVGLVRDGQRYRFRGSDVETRHLLSPHYKNVKAGTMANIPGGEAFTTPKYVQGQFIGDVVISLDQSYKLSAKDPFVIDCKGNSYKIIKEPKQIGAKFKEKKAQAWKKILEQEKSGSVPKSITQLHKKNFLNIGEFAINTNPKAELCDYLIVNEKIANMIHIALGSGFEPDRATGYHTDIVIDAPRQKLDIYGVDKKGKKYWIHRGGKFVI